MSALESIVNNTRPAAPTKQPPQAGDAAPLSYASALVQRPLARLTHMVTYGLCAMVAASLVFACLVNMDVVVSAQGKVIPSGKSKVIQPLEAGVVRSIHVRDGQLVKAGEALIELDATLSQADRDRLQREFWEAQADALRLDALLNGHNEAKLPSDLPADLQQSSAIVLHNRLAERNARMAGLDADIARRQADWAAISANLQQLKQSLPLIEQKYQMWQELAQTGHVAKSVVLDAQLELMSARKEIAVQTQRLAESQAYLAVARKQREQAWSEWRLRVSSEFIESVRKREAAAQELLKAHQRYTLQTLRAPIDGVVQQLAVTTVGGVVTPAQALMTLVPENATLEVEAQVLNRDAGHVHVGQRVVNKVESFDFTRYGYIEGEVLWVGTDAQIDPKLGPVFPIRIKLASIQTPQAVRGRYGSVSAGMSVASDIVVEQRRLIDYLLAPLLRYKQEALRER